MALDPELKNHVAYLQDHAHGLRATLAIADAVNDVSVLENAATEAEARRKAALDDLDTEIHTRNAALATANAAVEAATTEASNILDDAREAAAGIISAANDQALTIGADAKRAADNQLAIVRADTTKALDTLAGIKADIATARDGLAEVEAASADVTARAEQARAFLADLTAKG